MAPGCACLEEFRRMWDEVKHTWAVGLHGCPAKDRYGVGADRVNDINEDQLRGIRTLLGTLC